MKKLALVLLCVAWVANAEEKKPSGTTYKPGDEPVILGKGLTSQEVLKVITANLGEFRRCYEKALKRNPDMKGKVNNTFVIAPNGSLESVFADSPDMTDRLFFGCLNAHAARWKFPKSRENEDITLTYTATFNPL